MASRGRRFLDRFFWSLLSGISILPVFQGVARKAGATGSRAPKAAGDAGRPRHPGGDVLRRPVVGEPISRTGLPFGDPASAEP